MVSPGQREEYSGSSGTLIFLFLGGRFLALSGASGQLASSVTSLCVGD